MGFLLESTPLDWEASKKHLHYIREHGIEQFLSVYHLVKNREGDHLRWGDEIEYGVFHLSGDDANRTVQVSLRSAEIIDDLKRLEDHGISHGLSESDRSTWVPEYGAWMLESTPGRPFEGLTSILRLEDSMMQRRSRLLGVLRPGEIAPTMTSFPLLGVGDFCYPSQEARGPVANSLFIPDEAIYPHARFRTLTRNIRMRKGSNVEIRQPKFIDTNTVIFNRNEIPTSVEEADTMDDVYADAMAFGMGCCCLQVTLQAMNIEESRHLYDQVAVLTPIMLVLTAATPFLRGWLTDTDVRWDIISQCVDDRTPAERGDVAHAVSDNTMVGHGTRQLPKSRYSSMDMFMWHGDAYNDIKVVTEPALEERLIHGGIDKLLAKHVAHLFTRDPLVIFTDRINLDDRRDSDHWESLQSTNWQTVRWKPPPIHKGKMEKSNEDHIGWRVEFRSMEIQLTDFENAAFVVFIVLLSRVILGLDLNLYIPVSKIDENMTTAHKFGACTSEKFWFRKNLMPADITCSKVADNSDDCELMTINEILNGKGCYYPGLIPLCRTYLNFIGCDSVTRSKVERYLSFISARASGEILTTAQWIRQFIRSHPDYNNDSKIPASTAYDLLKTCARIGEGTLQVPELLGKCHPYTRVTPATNPFVHVGKKEYPDIVEAESCAKTACDGNRVPSECESRLLELYVERAVSLKVVAQESEIEKRKVQVEELAAQIDKLQMKLDHLKDTFAASPRAPRK